ncbi:hypothetical protein H2203_005495 [Taxawa tesnikishii (nom. ined.)]|nr:hypothetical protein H2203_005495 [Dothideales sp. JES 119]
MFARDSYRPNNNNNRVCSFYQQGKCKFGNNCKFDHPGAGRSQDSGGSGNRFGALQGQAGNVYGNRNNNSPRPGGDRYRPGSNETLPYQLSKDAIQIDLEKERPQWPLSSYGPGRGAPRQLIEGFPIEQSFEEMRVLHYLAVAQGNVQKAVQNEQELLNKSNQQVQQILSDLDGAIKYVLDGKDIHPNRLDMEITASGAGNAQQQPSPFGSAPSAGPGFGQPSALGATSSQPGLGRPAFGQASTPFGGSSQAGGFGKPSSLGGGGSPFGQPSAFGQPSPLGQPASAPSAFGQPSQIGQTGSAFGQASTPGQTTTTTPSAPVPVANPFSVATSQSTPVLPATADPSTYLRVLADGTLLSFKQRPVTYIDSQPHYQRSDGTMERIWHAAGPPAPNPDVEAPPETYDLPAMKDLKSLYEKAQTVGFEGGVIPEVPPKREWTVFSI